MRKPVGLEADVRMVDWLRLMRIQLKKYKTLFHVIMMDPPWKPNLKLSYKLLNDKGILGLPIDRLQTSGFLFLWIVNSKEKEAREFIAQCGYEVKDKIVWVKFT